MYHQVIYITCVFVADFSRFAEDIEMMLGYKPGMYWKICWKFVTPFIICVSIVDETVCLVVS